MLKQKFPSKSDSAKAFDYYLHGHFMETINDCIEYTQNTGNEVGFGYIYYKHSDEIMARLVATQIVHGDKDEISASPHPIQYMQGDDALYYEGCGFFHIHPITDDKFAYPLFSPPDIEHMYESEELYNESILYAMKTKNFYIMHLDTVMHSNLPRMLSDHYTSKGRIEKRYMHEKDPTNRKKINEEYKEFDLHWKREIYEPYVDGMITDGKIKVASISFF